MIWLFNETTLSPYTATGSGAIAGDHRPFPDTNVVAEEVTCSCFPIFPPTTRYT